MKISRVGVELIKSFESCRTKSYQDSAGVWTIGWGSTAGISEGMTMTPAECDALLLLDLDYAENVVRRLVTVPLTQPQFDALVSFAFNVGEGTAKRPGFKQSTLLRCLNKGNFADAALEFAKWRKAGGVVLHGLVRRRAAEAALFKTR